MTPRGFSQTLIIALVGVLVVVGAFLLKSSSGPADVPAPVHENGTVATSTPASVGETITTEKPTAVKPKPMAPPMPNVPTPKPASGSGTGATPTVPTAPQITPTTTTETPPAVAPTPAPTPAWSPGFEAAKRTYPEIPSENERATLPSCDGKNFSILPIDTSPIATIAAGTLSSAGGPAEYEVFTMKTKGLYDIYDVTYPADVWVTNVVQEQGTSADPEDSTVYFALCKDVIGYVTHVKELSTQTYKFVTDSYCLGKTQTGPNACRIELLTQVGKGSPLGKVGRYEGAFGFGIIDLRKPRGLQNPGQYAHPARMEFAGCPFAYFTDATSLTAKLATGDALCH